ncbi:MAG TPA: hypothetical protein GXX19_00630 [Syntrophomonadaceae bacterium]|nr:hypothetical protein [Syntrophomonadaceae bacterium]
MRGTISKGGGNASSAWRQPGGQGVSREGESEGHAEKFRAVVDETNRSAKDGERSCQHYGGEGITHPPHRTKVFADGTEWKTIT